MLGVNISVTLSYNCSANYYMEVEMHRKETTYVLNILSKSIQLTAVLFKWM